MSAELDIKRWRSIASRLRDQIPTASRESVLPMIDAAGELSRMADRMEAIITEQRKQAEDIARAVMTSAVGNLMNIDCQCAECKAARERQGQSGKLNS